MEMQTCSHADIVKFRERERERERESILFGPRSGLYPQLHAAQRERERGRGRERERAGERACASLD